MPNSSRSNPKSSAHVGDVRCSRNTFSLLSESDSESESSSSSSSSTPAVFQFQPIDPTPWGDQLSFEDLHIPETFAPIVSNNQKETTESDLWAQPWTNDLELHFSDCYDTSVLSEADYSAMLTWMYAQGWDIQIETRDIVQACPDTLPPRLWVPDRFSRIGNSPVVCRDCHSVTHAARVTDQKPSTVTHAARVTGKKAKSACVPHFCRASSGGVPCAEAGCRYVHADTMPRLNQPCGFGAGCGASDPTGVKRTQCLYMHPGETWDATMVITRLPAAAVSTETTATAPTSE